MDEEHLEPLGWAAASTILFCLGSLFAIAAPGDGQTGMFCYLLWLLGLVLGIISIQKAVVLKSGAGNCIALALLALICVLSFGWSIKASIDYESEWGAKRNQAAQHAGERNENRDQ